jgi:hypothetical protein
MLFRSILVFAFLFLNAVAFSQDRKVLGRVVEKETQKPVKNASITISGTTSMTSSNHLGYFELTIDISKHSAIIISCIGYKTMEVNIPEGDKFKLVLEKEYVMLNQLNLIGFPKTLSTTSTSPDQADVSSPSPAAETSAVFPGGFDQFQTSLGNALVAQLPASQSPFEIIFTINENGQPVDVSVSDSSTSVKEIVTTALLSLPHWTPATQLQKKAPQHFILPVIRRALPDVNTLDLTEFYTFFRREIKYPALARRTGIEGPVYVEFVLDGKGNPLSILLLQDIGADCGREVQRVIATTPPSTLKSLVDQAGVRKFILPVIFSLGKAKKATQPYTPKSDAFVLNEVAINAGALVIQKREIH